MCGDPEKTDSDNGWTLTPLTPEYNEQEHSCYVRAINTALDKPNIRNIALSGNYGVGKSSILQEVAKQHPKRVIELSLSTLGPAEIGDSSDNAATPTNQIQREIVKQLLYREKPHKTPGSRFRRIERFNLLHELALACVIGLILATVFLLTGWTEKIAIEFSRHVSFGIERNIFVFLITSSIVLFARYLLHGRIHLRQLSAGAATVTLDDKSISYFDQYLDEIVYFFEVSKCDIVIFEDIDRFEDTFIFENLRALNSLLNSPSQIGRTEYFKSLNRFEKPKKYKKPIRFIYAIKDSIFEQKRQEGAPAQPKEISIKDPALAEVVRANRTKFFDLIIPVVPFVTHRSARDLMTQLLDNVEHNIDPELIDLASRYIPDMRLLKNICNEFIIFRDRIYSGHGQQLGLRESELFAMMLYKSTHMADFEDIRLGKSRLDTIYQKSRELVSENIRKAQQEIRSLSQTSEALDDVIKRSPQIGELLIAHIERTVRAASYNFEYCKYTFNGSEINVNSLKKAEFWSELVQGEGDPVLGWSNDHRHGQMLRFMRSDLAKALNIPLDSEYWQDANRKALNAELKINRENLAYLRSADMDALIGCPEFSVSHEGVEQSFAEVCRLTLEKGLAYALVETGYINRNFTLYTSTFHADRVSPAATNFIIHHVDRHIIDMYFELTDNDVAAVLRERGRREEALSEPVFYNISILNYVLKNNLNAANFILSSIARLQVEQKYFLQAYLSSGSERIKLIESFTRISEKTLVYLVQQIELEEQVGLELIDTALANLDVTKEYELDKNVSAYLIGFYAELSTLKSRVINVESAHKIANIFARAEIKVPSLALLSKSIQQAFIEQNLYEVSLENLRIVLGKDTELALDAIRGENKIVYEYVLNNLSQYLLVTEGVSASVQSLSQFISIVNDVVKIDDALLDTVIARATENCIITDLEEVSKRAWPALARHMGFTETFNNIVHYIDSVGAIDEHLAVLLNDIEEIKEHGFTDESSKENLAVKILNANEYLPSAEQRVKLVSSLELANWLDVNVMPQEDGDLFALLLKNNVIEDSSESYTYLLGLNWSTRESYISVSEGFKNYVTADFLHDDLAAFISSEKVDDAIKLVLIEKASEYFNGSNEDDLTELANFVVQHKKTVAVELIEQMASKGVAAQDVIVLLQPYFPSLHLDQLAAILISLGGEYAKLAEVGKDQPVILDTSENHALLEVLISFSVVSKYNQEGNYLRVFKKHK